MNNATLISPQIVIRHLKSLANPKNVAGMARYGINPQGTLGISIPTLRALAKRLGKNHALAQELWDSGIHEARLLAGFIDDPAMVTKTQMERWAKDFDSWDVVDQVCSNLFDQTPFAYEKTLAWSGRKEEFIKRAGFTLMACLAVHDKAAPDVAFRQFLPVIIREAGDERNYVKKAVNWALRQIGKRNVKLNQAAVAAGEKIQKQESKSARWIAADALRELKSEAVRKKLTGRK
jgi:3-methyladenine DNA glycosylase AlkD